MTVTTRQNYDKIMWTEIDQIATTAFAVEKAKEEGKAEGKAEGKIETAKAMLAKKYSVEDIAEITGLSLEEIAKLAEVS
jgi:predicted transposase/invertase (TIGR01784 family)